MFKQEGVLYRDTRSQHGKVLYCYSSIRCKYVTFGCEHTKSSMRLGYIHDAHYIGDKPEDIEQYLVPLTFAQQAAIITDGCYE